MRRSNLAIVFGILFFLVGAALIFLVLNDDDGDGGSTSNVAGVQNITVVVATEPIEAGTFGNDVISGGTLTTRQVPSTEAPSDAITSVAELNGTVFAVPVAADAVIARSQFSIRNVGNVAVPEGFEALAVQMQFVAGGARYVGPGDTINVFAHFELCELTARQQEVGVECPPFKTPRTEILLTDVLVLDVDRQDAATTATPTTTPAGTQESIFRSTNAGPITYLLALTTTDVERVIFASNTATLYASLNAENAPPAGETPGIDFDNNLNPLSDDSSNG